MNIYIYASSTTQGGGGSFKYGKPIGAVGCCESRMAERSHWWTDRWLRSPLFLPLSFSFSDYLPSYLPTYLSIYLSVCLSTYLSASLKTKLFCETSSVFELDNVKNETILRDFFIFQTRLLHFFKLDNVKNETILRDFLIFSKWQHQKRNNSARLPSKMECSVDGLVPMRFAIFPLHLSRVPRLPRKIDARSYEVLHLSRKIILANLQIWCSKI